MLPSSLCPISTCRDNYFCVFYHYKLVPVFEFYMIHIYPFIQHNIFVSSVIACEQLTHFYELSGDFLYKQNPICSTLSLFTCFYYQKSSCNIFGGYVLFLLGKYLRVELLGHDVAIQSIYKKLTNIFQVVVTLKPSLECLEDFYCSEWAPRFSGGGSFLNFTNLVSMKQCLVMNLIFLRNNYVDSF